MDAFMSDESSSSNSEEEVISELSPTSSESSSGFDDSTSYESTPSSTSESTPYSSEDEVEVEPTMLYEGADLTEFDSHLLLFQFALRHSLTKKAFSELLDLVAVHVPQTAKVPRSVYKLKQYFLRLYPNSETVSYRYCANCHQLVHNPNLTCENGCQAKLREFLYVPVAPQLQRMLEGKSVYTYTSAVCYTESTWLYVP